MNLFDLFLVALLTYSIIMAFLRGLILELFSLGGLIVGLLLACWNYNSLSVLVQHLITAPVAAQVVAFFLIVIGVMVLSTFVGKALNRTAHAIGLGFFDRVFGAAFGFVRGCLFGVAILIAIAAFWPHSDWIENSRLSPYFLAGAHAVSFVVPHDLQQQILNGVELIKHNAPNWIKPPR